MSNHGTTALLGWPLKEVERLVVTHMNEVHNDSLGKTEGPGHLFSEYAAHAVYLTKLEKEGQPLVFPEA